MVTLGCARNEVDSEELAGRLAAEGYDLVDDADDADAVLVNTCGFIETAKKDSVDAILAATDSGASVVAVGWPAHCRRRRSSASTTTARSATGSTTSSPAARSCRTRRVTGAPCCRSARCSAQRRPRPRTPR